MIQENIAHARSCTGRGFMSAKMAVSVHELYPSLLDSCGRGDVITVQYLLNQGLNVDYIDKNGDFPLLMASSFGRLELIKFLLDKGASIDLVNPRGESALSKAIERDQTEVASLLQQYGAKNKRISTSQSSTREVLGEEAATSTTSFERRRNCMIIPDQKYHLHLSYCLQ